MSNPPRQFHAHGGRFDTISNAPTPELANMPKGTLPPRQMTSRAGNYNPESVVIPGFGYQPHGANMLHSFKPTVNERFYKRQNKAALVKAALARINSGNLTNGHFLQPEEIPDSAVDIAMHKSFKIFGESAPNAPGARFGPSESMQYLAPESKYDKTAAEEEAELNELNELAIKLIQEQIVSEKMLLNRYHSDLGGAIHVLEYPSRPGAELRKGTQLNYRYYNDITSAPHSGISGNRLTMFRDGDHQSVQPGPSVPKF